MSIIHNPHTNLAYTWTTLAVSCVLQASWHIREALWELGLAVACWQRNAPIRDAVSLTTALGTLGNGTFQGRAKAQRQVGVLPHRVMLSLCERDSSSNALPT